MTDQANVVVVGGGQAGLGVAYYLKAAGMDVVVFERHRLAETWRSQRWDSFVLNTPNWMNGLPGAPYAGPDPFGFMSGSELVASFEDYASRFEIPVRTGVNVTSVATSDGAGRFKVDCTTTGGETYSVQATSVVVASGILQTARIPEVSASLDQSVLQLTTATYRRSETLPDGAVVVIGGGQSGAQIVEDLLAAGRTVYFSISNAPRLPRSYRGRDFMDWWFDIGGLWDVAVEDVTDPSVLAATNPVVSGVGPLGHSVSYQQLARAGVRLMGRLTEIDDGTLKTDDRVIEYIQHADAFSTAMREKIDAYIGAEGVEADAAVFDPGDAVMGAGDSVDFISELDLEAAGVKTVIWSTGFTGDFSWIRVPVIDDRGLPIHRQGVGVVPGMYFLGFPWLSKRQSGVIYGIDEDAQRIVGRILEDVN